MGWEGDAGGGICRQVVRYPVNIGWNEVFRASSGRNVGLGPVRFRTQDCGSVRGSGIPFQERLQSYKWQFSGFFLEKSQEKKVTKRGV